jgi:hypothetical protein
VNCQFHRFLSVMCVVALGVISRSSVAQQAPQPPQPASPGTTALRAGALHIDGVGCTLSVRWEEKTEIPDN